MQLFNEFKITQKHYNLIIKQGLDNLPYETGGFLGGKEGVICGVLPTFNKDWDENNDVYIVTNEDRQRAHEFFHKYQLTNYGVYHTHPTGIAYPSVADINTGQMYHFIAAYHDQLNPIFNVFRIDKRQPIQLPLTILSDSQFSSLNLKSGKSYNPYEKITNNQNELDLRIQNMLDDKPNTYKKLPPKHDGETSGFSTIA